MSFLLLLLVSAQPVLQSPNPALSWESAPEGFGDAEAAAVLKFANSFIDEQGNTDHAAETAKRCEEMFDSGDVQNAMRQAQRTYGLRTVEWKALLHDCNIYIMGIRKGSQADSSGGTTPDR